MIFRIFYLFLFIGVLACNPPLKLKDNQLSAAQKSAHELKSQALVVRIPTQGRKINFLKQAITNPELDNKVRVKYERLLKEAMDSDREYLVMLDKLFNDYYNVTPVYFVPDSSFIAFKGGNHDVFIDSNGQGIPRPQIETNYLLLLTEDSRYKFKLFNRDGYKLPPHMPHKKDAFLPFLKVLLEKEQYVADQIIFFNTRLKEISALAK